MANRNKAKARQNPYVGLQAEFRRLTGQLLPPNDTTFELFYEAIQEPKRHPELFSKIEDVLGDVYLLREAYEPALLDETTQEDAQQMIDKVSGLSKLVENTLTHL